MPRMLARPCVALRPTTPQHAAGKRIDAAVSVPSAAAQRLALVCVALMAGYVFFGRLADAFARRGRSQLPLFVGGVAGSLFCLGWLALGVTTAAVLLWAGFVFCGTSATLAHSIVTRRYPRNMAGRVNTTLNTFTFLGIFVGQWGTGVILNLWPQSAAGYDEGRPLHRSW